MKRMILLLVVLAVVYVILFQAFEIYKQKVFIESLDEMAAGGPINNLENEYEK